MPSAVVVEAGIFGALLAYRLARPVLMNSDPWMIVSLGWIRACGER
jgi:hypothetical protein